MPLNEQDAKAAADCEPLRPMRLASDDEQDAKATAIRNQQAREFRAMEKPAFENAVERRTRAAMCNYFANLINVHLIAELQPIKDHQTYKSEMDPDTGKPFTWEEYCPKRLGISRQRADDLIKFRNKFGYEFIQALQGIKLKHTDVRILLQAPPEMQAEWAELEQAPADNREEKLQRIIGHLKENLAEAAGDLENKDRQIESQIDQINKRKKDAAKLEDAVRELKRDVREAKSGWSPTDDEAKAIEEIGMQMGMIEVCAQRIALQVRALPTSRLVLDQACGSSQSMVDIADDLRGVLLEVAPKFLAERQKEKAG